MNESGFAYTNSALLNLTLSLPWSSALALVFMGLTLSSYIKISVALGVLRTGFGFSSLPSSLVTGGLAIGLSLLVMSPTLDAANNAVNKALSGKTSDLTVTEQGQAIAAITTEWAKFLLKHSAPGEIERFTEINNKLVADHSASSNANKPTITSNPQSAGKPSLSVLIPSFLVTELKEACASGITILLPFLVIELLAAGILAALGNTQLNPSLVSLPFKLLLFIMADGWGNIVGGLASTYSSIK